MRHVALLLAVLCLLAPLTAVGASADVGGTDDAGRTSVTTPFDAAETRFTISLQGDGDARWTVTVLYRFEDEEARSAFETYAEEYESSGSTAGPSAGVFQNAASVASNTTGREMTVRSVNRTAELRNETAGVLRLRFTWTNFLERRSTGEYVLGDVFVSGSEETWFQTLGAGQRLVIQPPPGYTTTNVSVGNARSQIVNRNIVVSDPYTFAAGDIAITYEAGSQPFWQDTQVLLGSAGLLVLLVTAVYIVSRRRNGVGRGRTEHGGTSKVLPPGESPGEATAIAASADGNDGGDGTGGGGSGANDPDEPTPEPAPELLSDEERVERLLDRNGGRMRQADIVKETGWSDAKVSQLLSTMAEDGEVEKLRLGRENLISLPDEDGDDEDEDPRVNGR